MVDIVDSAKRSRMMSGIRNKNTKPEMIVRQFLYSKGFRYRLHVGSLPGKPDIVLPKYHAVVFVHGCFWHRHKNCRLAYTPKSRQEFWENKLNKNAARDKTTTTRLIDAGWRVMTIWECALRDSEARKRGFEETVSWITSDRSCNEYPDHT